MFVEECWFIYGFKFLNLYIGFLKYHSTGSAAEVDFDWEKVLASKNLIGWCHSHPDNFEVTSEEDNKCRIFKDGKIVMEINPKDPINFGGLINVPPTDSIKELYISTAPATFITPAAVVPPAVTQTNTSGGFPNIKTKKSTKSTISGGLGKGPLPESLRIEVRTIINDSF